MDFAGEVKTAEGPLGWGRLVTGEGKHNMQGFVLVWRSQWPADATDFSGFEIVEIQSQEDAICRMGGPKVNDTVRDMTLGELGEVLRRSNTEVVVHGRITEPIQLYFVVAIVEESVGFDRHEWAQQAHEGLPFGPLFGYAPRDGLLAINFRDVQVARARSGGKGNFMVLALDLGEDWRIGDLREPLGLTIEETGERTVFGAGKEYAIVGGKLLFDLHQPEVPLDRTVIAFVTDSGEHSAGPIRFLNSRLEEAT